MKNIYQIKIELKDIEPKIWRRILVSSDLLLSDFHKVLQTSMNWFNSHLHQFIKDKKYYMERLGNDDLWNDMESIDYKGMQIYDLLDKEGDNIRYVYDFGDYWDHEIILEKIYPYNPEMPLPACIDGERCGPPEDCGGTGGYEAILKILRDPNHEEYLSLLHWLGGGFDPEECDCEEITDWLQSREFGCWEEDEDEEDIDYW